MRNQLTIAATLCMLLIAAERASAFDRLEVEVVNPQLVQGRPAVTTQVSFSVRVRAVNADGSTDLTADFINAELYTDDVPATLPPRSYLQAGERQFDNLVFLASGSAIRLRVRDADDLSVPFGEVLIDCYDYVDAFTVVIPPGDKFVDQAIDVTLQARDINGNLVLNFRDDVVLDALVGDFSSGATITVPGTSFSLGQVTVPVVFWGTDPITRENTLTATNTRIYTGQGASATGSAIVTPLRPGSLSTVVLVLPGEILTPGVSPGKSGSPLPQVSGNAFNGVDVYATDLHWNPVEPTAYPNLSWSTDDPSAAVLLPPGGPMASNVELDETIRLIQSGLRRVTVTASGSIAATSESNVVVNPEGLDHFVFDYTVWDTTDVQVTTIPFQLRVRAQDINNNSFPFNGQVTIRAKLGTSDESEDYVIVSNTTFVNGQLDALVQVTKRAFSARVVVDSNGGVVAESGRFQVNSGPLDRILLTFPGETWVPGLNDPNFSGNTGTPNNVVAGQEISPVTVRPVDRYANIVSGLRNVTMSSPTGYFQLPDYPNNLISLSNPVDIRVILRTAGQQQLAADASGVNPNLSAAITVSPAPFSRMVVEAPGESLEPGIFDSIEDDGKIGQPSVQDAGVSFNVRVYAADAYWNPITDFDPALPISAAFSSSDLAAVLPPNPQALNNNFQDFGVTLITLADPNQQTIRVDDNASAAFGFTTIPVKAGTIDHFDIGINNRTNPTPADVLDPVPDHQAGSFLPNLTIVARDVFNNHVADYTDSVTMYVSHGTNVLQPIRVSLGDGYGSGAYQGAWRGSIQITKAGSGVRLFVREEVFASTDSSNVFNVFAGTYEDLLLLLPGETATPGIAPGKVGTPLPVSAGAPVVATVLATDRFWNPVVATPTVHFASDGFFQMISANDQPLNPDGSGSFDLFFKTAAMQALSVSDLISPAQNDTSRVVVQPGAFDRLMVLAPGETPNPGGPESDGKIGAPIPQTASLEFDLRVRAVDQFWNLVDNSSEHISLASDDNSLSPTNPVNNGQPLVNGEITFPVFLTSPGFVTLGAAAMDNTDLLGQSVTVQVEQGAAYLITVPPSASVGPPSTFSMTIALVDSNGAPLPAANNFVTLKALKSNLEPATSSLFVTGAQLSNGSVTISNQAYDTVEDIVIQISDVSGRLSYSNIIQMQPNGLEYVVNVDSSPSPRVGPPSTFGMSVRLQDSETKTLVREDRPLTIAVFDGMGLNGRGTLGVVSQRLDRGSISFQQSYTRAENIYFTVTDSTGLSGNSPIFAMVADGYKKLQIVAPGEVVEAGVDSFVATGKSGSVFPHRSGELFPLTVRAVDQYWNLADTTNGGNLRLVASDNSYALPGNPNVNFVPFVNGKRTFTGFLTDPGQVTVTVYDEDDLGKPEQAVVVPVDPPFQYEITVPSSASTGPVPGFQVVVKLVDPSTGNVVPTAQHRFSLSPLLPSLAVANGSLGIQDAQLIDGVAVINNQSYDTVEDILIRVSDAFGRETLSSVIRMDTGGLFFSASVPDSAIVGPPATFTLDVELIDSNTGQRVVTQDRLVDIRVLSASTGVAGTGVLGVAQGQLSGGLLSIAQSYTRAEDIFLEISDSTGVIGLSNTCRMMANGFKRIQIVAPGETVDPGSSSATGKTGQPLTQQAEAPFTIRIRAVDQYFNLVESVDDGELHLSYSGSALDLVDPNVDGAPFINGSRDFEVILGDPGVVSVFATDALRPQISTGRVDIPVNEAEYRIILPNPATVTAGPPATFPVTVRLVNPLTDERINAGSDFTMQALKPDRSPATDVLGINGGTLVAGEAVIGGQTYATSEQIIIRVSDSRGREAFSDPLTVQPVGVTWAFSVPDTVVAGEPWTMAVRRVDIVTGQLVTLDDRSFTLRAFSGNAARPDTSLTPIGVLCDSTGSTLGGEIVFSSQCYDRAEGIYLELTDLFGERAFSPVITVLPAPADGLRLLVEEVPGRPVARPVRPMARILAKARVVDRAGNPLSSVDVQFQVLSGDGWLGSGQDTVLMATTTARGEASVDLTIRPFAQEDIRIVASAVGLSSNEVVVDVVGPPQTVLRFDPPASPYQGGWFIDADTRIELVATTEDVAGIQAIYSDVDVVDPPLPRTIFTGAFSLRDVGRDTPGVHTLRFYAEEVSGTTEPVRTVELYTSSALTTEKQVTNRPNPFRAGEEETIILFQPTSTGTAQLVIYDLFGSTVFSARMPVVAGTTAQFPWNGRNGDGRVVANGGYICRIVGAGYDLRRKIAVVK